MVDFGTLQNIYTVTKQIYDIVKSIKNAPEEIRDLERQIVLVHGTLEALKLDLEGREDVELNDWSTEPCLKMLERAKELTDEAETFLKKVTKETTKKAGDEGSMAVRKRKWVISGAADAKALAAKFHGFHGSLCAVQSAMHLQLSRHGLREANEGIRTLAVCHEESIRILQQTVKSNAAIQHSVNNIEERVARIERTIYTASRDTLTSAASTQSHGINQAFDEITTTSSVAQFPSPTHIEGGGSLPHPKHTTDELLMHRERPTCDISCKCRCHGALTSIIPAALSSFFGRLYVPQGIHSILTQPRKQCDEPTCRRQHADLLTIKYYFPAWFKQINAEIRVENQSSIHFLLRIPRVVSKDGLNWLDVATVDEVREKLRNHELTVNDVDPDGRTVLHVVTSLSVIDRSETMLSILALLMEHSVPAEWEWNGLMHAEYALLHLLMFWRSLGSREAALCTLRLQFFSYLSQNIEDVWEELAIELGWTYLHRCLGSLSSPPTLFIAPELASQINTRDYWGYTPLDYAVLGGSDAVHVLLRAGANPRITRIMLRAVQARAYTGISALIRAGASIHASDSNGKTILHWASNTALPYFTSGLKVATELVRHAGHMLGSSWDILVQDGSTALDCAQQRARQNPSDEDAKHILDLYTTRRLPKGEQYLPTSALVDIEGESAANDPSGLPPTSLIRAGLNGDIDAIGDLIEKGAMVNERDHEGLTLLHLIALGRVSDGYRVALELVRHGGWGVDWDALTPLEDTALDIVQRTLVCKELTDLDWKDMTMVRQLLQDRRLPAGEEYLWPCMDPDFYEPRMPGAYDN